MGRDRRAEQPAATLAVAEDGTRFHQRLDLQVVPRDGVAHYVVNISAVVLIMTCPCALGLAVPTVVTAASGKLFRRGELIKTGLALERLTEVYRCCSTTPGR